MAIAAGTRFNHYEIIAPLGAGGMGEVYLAEDQKLKRRVALKWLPETRQNDLSRLQRFQTEAEAAAQLNHPNIATIHSVEETGGQHFITMEYVEGKSLETLIPQNGLELKTFFQWFNPLAEKIILNGSANCQFA